MGAVGIHVTCNSEYMYWQLNLANEVKRQVIECQYSTAYMYMSEYKQTVARSRSSIHWLYSCVAVIRHPWPG